jgi:hypothetical protein
VLSVLVILRGAKRKRRIPLCLFPICSCRVRNSPFTKKGCFRCLSFCVERSASAESLYAVYLFAVAVVVAVAVIARGALSPRGNPETDMPCACHSARMRRIPQCLLPICRCRCRGSCRHCEGRFVAPWQSRN